MDISNNDSTSPNNNAIYNQKKKYENNTKNMQQDHIQKDNNELNNQFNNILSYYYTTYIYLLNLEKNFNISYINKSSKNFVLKNKMNFIAKNQFNNNNIYNVNYINNCINKKNNMFKYDINNEYNNFNNLFINKSMNFNYNLLNKSYSYFNNNDLFKINNNINNSKAKPKEFFVKISEESSIKDKGTDLSKDNNKFNVDDSLVIMFGRRGWVCQFCNNFNYETRIKCNRCGIKKTPKKVSKNFQKSEKYSKKGEDWICAYCSNLNYSFRTVCNRCNIKLSENNKILASVFH